MTRNTGGRRRSVAGANWGRGDGRSGAAVVLLTLLAGCGAAASHADMRVEDRSSEVEMTTGGTPRAGDCPLFVRFGSYAGGIDQPALEAVLSALRSDARVKAVEVRAWGREGEQDLCVSLKAAEDAQALTSSIRRSLPSRKLNGYVEVHADGTRLFTTQPEPS